MSVNNITSKILRDAEGRKESILAAAEEEKNKILSKKVASAKELETEILETQNFQGNAVVNYTGSDVPYTRIIEHKHFETENPNYENAKTVISKEFSTEWKDGMESFYPVNDEKNAALFEKYNELSKSAKNVIFGGRLAEYKYYDMDDVIEKVIKDVEQNKLFWFIKCN